MQRNFLKLLLFLWTHCQIDSFEIKTELSYIMYVCVCVCVCVCLCAYITLLIRLAHIKGDSYYGGNKMPTRCNRGFYCRSYCLLNMFRAPLCQSPGAQEYYTVVAACGISCCDFQVVVLVWSWGLCVHRHQLLYNTLELLMLGIVVPETCWASNKICNKNLCCI